MLFCVSVFSVPFSRSRTTMFGEPPLSEIMKSSLSSRLREEPVKYSSCVFQPFSSPAHPPTSVFSFKCIFMYLL